MKKSTPLEPKKKRGFINFRITEREEDRLDKLIALLQDTNPFVSNVDCYKELMSLTDRNLISSEMRSWLSGNDEAGLDDVIIKETKRISASKKKGLLQG